MYNKIVKDLDTQEDVIEIVIAIPEDAKGIREVQYKTWLVTYPNQELGITIDDIEDRFKDAFSDKNIKEREDRLRNQLSSQKVFIAKTKEKIVGFCIVTKLEDKNQINAIYILPGLQGRGLGKALWAKASEFLDLTKDTTVEVASYNTKAIEFYRKIGFTETGKQIENEKLRKMKSGAVMPEMEMIRKGIKK